MFHVFFLPSLSPTPDLSSQILSDQPIPCKLYCVSSLYIIPCWGSSAAQGEIGFFIKQSLFCPQFAWVSQCIKVLMATNECLWGLFGAHGCSSAWFKNKENKLGVPHSRIHVKLGFILQAETCQILNFAQNPRQSVQGTELNWGEDTAQKKCILGGGDTEHIFWTGCQ